MGYYRLCYYRASLLLLDSMTETHFANVLEKMEHTSDANIGKPAFKKILAAVLEVKMSDKRIGTLVNQV